MSKQYFYRGITAQNKWVFGGIYESPAGTIHIVCEDEKGVLLMPPVDRKTVGKYLMDDKWGQPIFSGDLVEVDGYDGVFEITYAASEAQYELSNQEAGYILTFDNVWNYDCTVVGNKYTQKTEDFVYEQE